MDADQIRSLKPQLRKYLKVFGSCFRRQDTRRHLKTYVEGQMSNLSRKSVEPMAIAARVPPRTLQQFLDSLVWEQEQMIDTLQQVVARDHGSPRSIGLIDETACPKKGKQTPGVQRQWCGATGKVDNCLVTVHLGYAVDDFHCLLGSELFLPESWSEDRPRCRRADIPDSMSYRPKWRVALELLDRARANGVTFGYLVFDEGYGGKPEFLRELQARGQRYVAEAPRSFHGWLTAPRVTDRPYHRGDGGRGRATPRIVAGSPPAHGVEYHLDWTPELKSQPWKKWRVKDTTRGPMVWEVKQVRIVPKDEQDLPGEALHLIVARNALEPGVIKYFVSNAPADTPLEEMLWVAFSRWRVERCFEDQKTELGFDHFEGRSYLGLKRHQAITAVTHLFLARVREQWGEKDPRTDGLPGPDRGRCRDSLETAGKAGGADPDRGRRRGNQLPSTPQRRSATQPSQGNSRQTARPKHPAHRPASLPLARKLAL